MTKVRISAPETPGPGAWSEELRVAHCIHGLGLGGAQKVITSIVEGSLGAGIRPYVYTSDDGVLRPEIEAAGAVVRVIPRLLPKFDPVWVARLAREMRRDDIRVVHAHLFGDSLHGYLAAVRAGRLPVVMTLHNGAHAHTRLQRLGYRWLLERTASNVACSESVRRFFLGEVGQAPVEILTITNGIPDPCTEPVNSAEVRRRLGIGVGEFVIGAVGRLVEQKGFRYLVTAFARVHRSLSMPIRLVLVGDGSLRSELESEAAREGVAEHVLFAGFRADAAELVRGFDVVVFSSLFEGLPVALLEAMAASKCIVGTRAEGIMDALTDGETGVLVATGDVAELASALTRVISDEGLRSRLGCAARRRFLAGFTASQMVDQYRALYRDVCATT